MLRQTALLFFILFCCFSTLSAQVSYNVRLKAGQAATKAALYAAAANPQRAKGWPFAENLQKVEPLVLQNRLKPEVHTLSDWFTLTYPENERLSAQSKLLKTGFFEVVEPNFTRKLDAGQPNDTSVSKQFYHKLIKTFEAWAQTKGEATVVVGVIDTGVDYLHDELRGQIKINAAEDLNGNGLPDSSDFNGIDEDGNGYADDVMGFDFVDQTVLLGGGDFFQEDPDPMDDNQHGTLVSGILLAKENNTAGGTGVAPGCRVLPIRAFSGQGVGEDDDISRAIIYGALSGCRILNLSFGDIYPSQMMRAACLFAYNKGVCLIASAGNATGDNVHYPSDFDEVISVSASAYSQTSQTEYLWPLSSYGTGVDLCAPGSGIFAPTIRDEDGLSRFGFFSGTSTSTPMVSGAAALLLSLHPELTPAQIRGILTTTADDIEQPGWDHFTGAGRLNIERALAYPFASDARIFSPETDSGVWQDTLKVVGSALHPLFVSWRLSYRVGSENNSSWIPLTAPNPEQVFQDTLLRLDIAAFQDTIYTLRLQVQLANGQTAEDRTRFVIDRTPPVVKIETNRPIWEDNVRRHFVVSRSSDAATQTLYYRLAGTTLYTPVVADKRNKTVYFLFSPERAGSYQFFVEAVNAAGLKGVSSFQTFDFQPDFVPTSGAKETGLTLPMGAYLPQVFDFDSDGNQEVLMSRYTENFNYGRVQFHEYDTTDFAFHARDSIAAPNILLPKNVADIDGDGRLELLSNFSDNLFLHSQNATNDWPKTLKFNQNNSGLFPCHLADVDGDGKPELIAKDTIDHFILKWNGAGFDKIARLADETGNYYGSSSPKALVADFDGDGKTEIVAGDYDGDLRVFEHAGGANFPLKWVNKTDLQASSDYLLQGDFDGDGKPEFFVATHANTLRNESDFEYYPQYWQTRIFKAAADTFQTVYDDLFFNINSEFYSFAHAGNFDEDAADEILFVNFPRVYVLDFVQNRYVLRWYFFGAVGTHSVSADFNGNGVQEFTLPLGDASYFVELSPNFSPEPTLFLQGKVTGAKSVRLNWNEVAGATQYVVFGAKILGDTLPDNIPALAQTANLSIDLAELNANSRYFFAVQAVQPTNVLAQSNAFVLSPQSRNRLLSVEKAGENSLLLTFSNKMTERSSDIPYFFMDGKQDALSVSRAGDRRLLVSFRRPFAAGNHVLRADTSLLDAENVMLEAAFSEQSFNVSTDSTQYLYLTNWKKLNDKEAELYFNLPLKSSSLLVERFDLKPFGSIESVALGSATNAVRVRIRDARFAPLGYPQTVLVKDILGANNEPMLHAAGDAATFWETLENNPNLVDVENPLGCVFAFPNPVRHNQTSEGCRIGCLPARADISIYNIEGWKVIDLQETDGDGGLSWNLRNQSGERVRPGVYIFWVKDADGNKTMGKIAVIE